MKIEIEPFYNHSEFPCVLHLNLQKFDSAKEPSVEPWHLGSTRELQVAVCWQM